MTKDEDAKSPYIETMDVLTKDADSKTALQKYIEATDALFVIERDPEWMRLRANRITVVELDKPLVVLTARHQMFRSWCHEHRLNPRDRRLIRVSSVYDMYRVRGLRDFEVTWLEDWAEIPHYDEVYAYVRYRIACGEATERTDQ